MDIEAIHNSNVDGQFDQMVRQIKEYGLYSFWYDYNNFLEQSFSEMPAAILKWFTRSTIMYHKIKYR